MSGKITEQLTTTGEFVAAYKSAYLANAMSMVPYSTIKHAINGRKSREFTWKELATLSNVARRKNTVKQTDTVTGELVAVFSDIETAAELNGVSPSAITRVISGGRKSLMGYTFGV